MLGSEVLEVGIGLTLLFLFISLICTAVLEGIEAVVKMRAKDLERGIKQLLGDEGSSLESFYKHPLVFSLFRGEYKTSGRNLPSYIPADTFANVLLDMLARGESRTGTDGTADSLPPSFETLRASAMKCDHPPELRGALLWALDHAQGDLALAKANLEGWYNATMDRVSGWYKRRTQFTLFGIGLASAVVLNIDAITVAQRLSQDKPLRDAAIAWAANASSAMAYSEASQNLQNIGYSIGWEKWWPGPQKTQLECTAGSSSLCFASVYAPSIVGLLLGWLITAFAVMLGAPFWFDLLNRFMVIRSTVKPHEKSPEEASEDLSGGGIRE